MTGSDEDDATRKRSADLAARAPRPLPGVSPLKGFDDAEVDAATQMITPFAAAAAPVAPTAQPPETEVSESFVPTRSVEMNKDPTGEWLFPEKKEDTVSRPRRRPRLTGDPASLIQQLGSWLVDLTLIVLAARLISQDEEVRRLAVLQTLQIAGRPALLLPAAMLVVGIPYELLGALLWGRSFGRLLFGVQLVDVSGDAPGLGRALIRAVLSVLSWCGGFVLTFVDRKGQMLHEKLTATWVVRNGTSGLR